MEKNNSKFLNSITILVSPWEKGFSCSIITCDSTSRKTSKQHELCSTIAKGMCYAANQNPDKIFKLGLQASGLKKTKNNLPKKNNSNVIDFLQYLRIKRGEEKN